MPIMLDKIITKEDQLKKLKLRENQLEDGIKKAELGINQAALAIYDILNERLYLAEVDEKGIPLYPTQESYLPFLAQRVGKSRSTLFAYKRTVEFALEELDLTPDKYIELGGNKIFNKVVQESEGKELDKDYIIEKLEKIKDDPDKPELSLTPQDKMQAVVEIVNPNKIDLSYVSIFELNKLRELQHKVRKKYGGCVITFFDSNWQQGNIGISNELPLFGFSTIKEAIDILKGKLE